MKHKDQAWLQPPVEVEDKVNGHMVYNGLLMQFQVDILGISIVRPEVAETASLGAAYAAGLVTRWDLDSPNHPHKRPAVWGSIFYYRSFPLKNRLFRALYRVQKEVEHSDKS